jgi:hypothetical protein
MIPILPPMLCIWSQEGRFLSPYNGGYLFCETALSGFMFDGHDIEYELTVAEYNTTQHNIWICTTGELTLISTVHIF